MNLTVYKYPLQIAGVQTLSLPAGYRILSVQNQYERPYLWALVDTANIEPDDVTIFMAMTGQLAQPDVLRAKFIGTVQLLNGDLVLHYFADLPAQLS